MTTVWQVFVNSLLFVAVLGVVVAILWFYRRGTLKFSLHGWGLNRVAKLNPIKINCKRWLAANQSLVEIEWAGTRYLLHVENRAVTVIDQKPIPKNNA